MGVTHMDPSMYPRIEVDEEAQRAYLWIWGNRYEIRTVDAKHEPIYTWGGDELPHCQLINPVREIVFGVRRAPVPPPPPPPRRRQSTALGLRRPKP